MRRGKIRKFGRTHIQRAAFVRSLATALIDNGKIKTTQARAKVLTSHMDKLVTLAKKGDLSARKLLLTKIGEKAVKKLMSEVAPRYMERNGGYTTSVNLGRRKSDGAPVVVVEFIS